MNNDKDCEWLYVKSGRRYKKVRPFYGFPCDGVWIVSNVGRANELVLRLSGIPETVEEVVSKAISTTVVQGAVAEVLKDKDIGALTVDAIARRITEKVFGNKSRVPSLSK
jgi:hypothetical protein